MNSLEKFLLKFKQSFKKSFFCRLIGNYRDIEYKVAYELFKECTHVLDVGCGSGGFLEILQKNTKIKVVGTDFNPDCVDVCLTRGLDVTLGNALDMPYQNNSFDGVYCSHVMQVFSSSQAVTLIKELSRVVKPNGIIVITTIPMHERLFFDPGDVRPYPPQALRGMFAKAKADGHSAPTVSKLPPLAEEFIWFRRPPLIDFNFQRSQTLYTMGQFLNQVQYFFYLRKYWGYNGYMMALRNKK
jgi:ubiquinone/menaquinone biosynthesis C-methylase UbiE